MWMLVGMARWKRAKRKRDLLIVSCNRKCARSSPISIDQSVSLTDAVPFFDLLQVLSVNSRSEDLTSFSNCVNALILNIAKHTFYSISNDLRCSGRHSIQCSESTTAIPSAHIPSWSFLW